MVPFTEVDHILNYIFKSLNYFKGLILQITIPITENSMEILKKIKNRSIPELSSPTCRIYVKKVKSTYKTLPWSIVALLIIDKIWTQARCP